MTDAQIEIPANGSQAKDQQNKSSSDVKETKTYGCSDKTAKSDTEPAQREWKGKYNGRSKKRQWQFNRRDDSVKRVRAEPEAERVKRRKYLLVIGYAGANYIGMQRNPGVNTIEEELLKALFKNKLITEEGFNQPQHSHFQRAARTDKGVSAARQCISLKLREYINYISVDTYILIEILFFIQRSKLT